MNRRGGWVFPTITGLLVGGAAAGCGPATTEPTTGKAVSPPQTVTCPEGQAYKDGACVATAPPKSACPEGQVQKDGACAPAQPTCAAGTHADASGACVADAPAPQASASASAPASQGPCPVGMALVKGGSYKLGFIKTEATVGDLCHDLTEATAKEYEQCVGTKKCNENLVKGCPETSTYKVPGKEDHPMVCIDFTQATDYCAAQGKRLPTEEEWEWAARGGAEGRQYSWGNEPPGDQACWSGKTPLTGTCPVKAHPGTATAQGLLGMSGNVFEWATRKLDAKVKERVGRGGSWRDGLPNVLRVDRPGSFEITYRCGFLGVRCVTEPKAK